MIVQYLGASDCKLNEGSMRADVNLSVREIGAYWQIKLTNLIILWIIWIEIIFPVKFAVLCNCAIHSKSNCYCIVYYLFIKRTTNWIAVHCR